MEALEGEREGLLVVSPVFNDWVCANELVRRLAVLAPHLPTPLSVWLVDDGSTEPCTIEEHDLGGAEVRLRIVHAAANLGHQRAIAVGLATALETDHPAVVAVIDADGEDDPAGLPALISALNSDPEVPAIAVAQRRDRTESLRFRTFYRLYKVAFRALTGRALDFGNFSVMTPAAANRMLRMPELWNHFPATAMKSRVPVSKVALDRNARFYGSSRMNFVSLINHGLAAMAAFADVVFARLLIVVSIMSAFVLAAGAAVVAVRLLSTQAIPGWATAAMGFVILALFQLLALLAVMTFIQLSSRSNIPQTPAQAAPHYVASIEELP